ncbi:preprotein translocase subunit SecG [Aminivibrio sp.]|uniref:preprotein translocase subunit SecG n=1 Tax=Aminivibrio sp. TaxID=1872489 RepID=UPI001A5047FF|nr:preprotein translocase subunit SecG [Aminivibrio sp.]MBL3539026.1 preprotein translocase subunit SecG [Aminivibrio sp.]
MKTILGIVHILLCISLSGVVLLQQRKQGGFSGIFGGGTQADMGGNQWQRFTGLSKITVVLTGLFMITSIILVLY